MLTSCANIIPPGGGPRDSIPPKLIMASPADSATNVNTNRIVLTFDEFVEAKDVLQNLVVSPNQKNSPVIDYKLKNVTIKLRDSLEPNTTYSFNFGNAIKDVNEGNVAKNFTYAFSTGKTLDKNTLSGTVLLAETGKSDSTLIVCLYKNLNDSAVIKLAPTYYAKVNAKGNFTFNYLPEGKFAVYVMPDEYTKKYNDSTKMFAFLNAPVAIATNTKPINLYAFEEVKKTVKANKTASSNLSIKPRGIKEDNRLRVTKNLENGKQDILNDTLQLSFNRKIESFDTAKITLTDTNFISKAPYRFVLDSTRLKLNIICKWRAEQDFKLVIAKDAVKDSLGQNLYKADTTIFTTKKESDYGSLRIRLNNLQVEKNPVLQFVQNDKLIQSISIQKKDLFLRLFYPGEYELRILYDENKNGIWDTGNFKLHKQPEIVQGLTRKIIIKNNWDNEYEINLPALDN